MLYYKICKEVRRMRYRQVKKGIFLARPNRFIAPVALDGVETVCHV